ncbi:hypothetical protein PSENEW3n2_00000738 [Picochlorum sp. SENEW3]|nr:hypothetical protein PSENEW3n2_00000738 [Picochlorum sp. SENEW3]WPT15659.1 hypothetical protein PSENEW3_00000738 [Picochlorum sp. SENEW3]
MAAITWRVFLLSLVMLVSSLYTGIARAQHTTGSSNAIKEALADSIRLRAEAKKASTLAKHGGNVGPQVTPQPAKTKNFAFTKIDVNTDPANQ